MTEKQYDASGFTSKHVKLRCLGKYLNFVGVSAAVFGMCICVFTSMCVYMCVSVFVAFVCDLSPSAVV